MKNKLYILNDVFYSILGLWKSDLFKEEQLKENSFVNTIVKKLSDQKLCFYNFSNEAIEKRHMTPWFNHVGLRNNYDNKIVQDMYLIHELFHIAYLPNSDDIIENFDDWKNEMWRNELIASLSTEIFIYVWIPELRNKTFDFEIWFDLLKSQYGYDFSEIELNPEHVFNPYAVPEFKKVIDLRIEFRNGKKATNKSEEWFVRYNNYEAWFERWRNDYINIQKLRRVFVNDFNNFDYEASKYTKDDIIFNFNIA